MNKSLNNRHYHMGASSVANNKDKRKKETLEFLFSGRRQLIELNETEQSIETARMIVRVIRQIADTYDQDPSEVYQVFVATGTIQYMIGGWRVLHTFSTENVAQRALEHAERHGGFSWN